MIVDWSEIRKEYISGASYKSLADKYKMSKSYIAKRGKAEGWADDRILKTTNDSAVEVKILASTPKTGTSDKIVNLVNQMLNEIEKRMKNPDLTDDQLRNYASALKNLQQVYSAIAGTQYLIDMERIEALKRQHLVIDATDSGVVLLPEVIDVEATAVE